jgi:hypothetical protein
MGTSTDSATIVHAPVLPVRSHIRLLTADPRYGRLNRLDCLGVGEVRPRDYLYVYDMYAIR